MYRHLSLTKLSLGALASAATANTAPPRRRGRNDRRRRGVVVPALVLILAAAMLLNMPAARAVDSFAASKAVTDPLCQLSSVVSNDVFKLPELGGSFVFTTSGIYTEGLTVGKARLTGTITGGSTVATFDVDLVVEGRLDGTAVGNSCLDLGLRPECGATTVGWHVYTALSGTLTGKSGPFDGAVYNLSLGTPTSACVPGTGPNPVFQVGDAANTHNLVLGAFAPLNFELADPTAFPSLPTGPFAGEVSLNIGLVNRAFPTPSPDLTGTWRGSIDCAGIADFTDTESFTGPSLVLEVKRELSFSLFPVPFVIPKGLFYSVELSDGAGGVIKRYCAEFANDLAVDSNQGSGRMISDDILKSTVFLKVRKNPSDPAATLEARQLIVLPDGSDFDLTPDGINLCKWTFTQTSTTLSSLPRSCPNFTCGDGVLMTDGTEECDDGNHTSGDGCSFFCTIEP